MRFRAAAAGSLLMLTAVACAPAYRAGAKGSDGRSIATPASSRSPNQGPIEPTETPLSGVKQVVTRSDSETTVELRVGDSLGVQLPSAFPPAVANQDGVLVRTSSSGGYPTGQSMVAVFRAVTSGRIDVSSTTDYQCLHATPSCGLAQELWSVHVVVTG